MTSTPLIWQGLFDKMPADDEAKTPRSLPNAELTVSGGSALHSGGPTAPKSMMDFLSTIHTASRNPLSTGPTFASATLSTAWRTGKTNPTNGNDAPPPEEDTAKPVVTKAKGKKADKNATAVPAPETKKKPKPTEVFVPFVLEVVAQKRIPSKDAAILTNGFSAGATEAPQEMDQYVAPPSLFYVPSMTNAERRNAHRVLADE
jgi:hypothetical protein